MHIKYAYLVLVTIFSLGFVSSNYSQENNAILCADGIDNDGDGLIDCDDQECATLVNEGCRTCFDDGLSFADLIIDYNNPCGNSNIFKDPNTALGVSDHAEGSGRFVSLGSGGWIKLSFINNLLVNSGDDKADLWIFEIGPAVEATFIEIQPANNFTLTALMDSGVPDVDSDGYYEVGQVAGSTSALDIDVAIPGYASGELKFHAVKLLDDGDSGCGSGAPGADIDAVCALSSIPAEVCDNGIDDDLDGKVDCDDEDLAMECCCTSDKSLDLGQDVQTCVGDTIILNAPTDFVTYLWQDGSGLPTLNTVNTGLYRLTVTDDMACEFIDQVFVSFEQLPVVTTRLDKCPGTSVTFNGITFFEEGMVDDTFGSSGSACDTIYRIQVVDHEIEHGFLGPDLSICGSATTELQSPWENTTWPDGSQSNQFSIEESNLYIVQAQDSNNCTITDSIQVDFIRNENFYMPTAFFAE